MFFFRLDASVGQRKNSESPWRPFFMGQRKILSPHEDFLSSQWLLKVICINFGQFWTTTRKMLDKFFHEIAVVWDGVISLQEPDSNFKDLFILEPVENCTIRLLVVIWLTFVSDFICELLNQTCMQHVFFSPTYGLVPRACYPTFFISFSDKPGALRRS